jgi:polyhydroxybutyrate depolymerase
VDDRPREILVHVPPAGPTTAAGYPLVIAFHGFTGTTGRVARTWMLGPMADADGFVVAYPQGVGLLPAWHFPGGPARTSDGVNDLHLVDALLRHAAAEWCIDGARVVLVGHSLGGAMAQAAACAMAERVAGLVLAAAVQEGAACEPGRPVHVVALHALDDAVVPYGGMDATARRPWSSGQLPVEAAMADWAARNACAGGPTITPAQDGGALLAWQGCDAPVVLFRLADGGHRYPAQASDAVRAMVQRAALRPSPAP